MKLVFGLILVLGVVLGTVGAVSAGWVSSGQWTCSNDGCKYAQAKTTFSPSMVTELSWYGSRAAGGGNDVVKWRLTQAKVYRGTTELYATGTQSWKYNQTTDNHAPPPYAWWKSTNVNRGSGTTTAHYWFTHKAGIRRCSYNSYGAVIRCWTETVWFYPYVGHTF